MSHAVTVYRYKYWDEESKTHKTSALYATADMIRSGLGQALNETAIKVAREGLREGGFYFPARIET